MLRQLEREFNMTPEFETIDLYSHWASALINNDYSSTDLDKEDLEEISYLSETIIPGALFYDCDNSRFGFPDYPEHGLKGDISTYYYIPK